MTKMSKLDIKRLALAAGATAAAVSAICFILVVVLPSNAIVAYTNSIFHGTDFAATFVKPGFSIAKLLLGAVSAFATAAVIVAIFAFTYNAIQKTKE